TRIIRSMGKSGVMRLFVEPIGWPVVDRRAATLAMVELSKQHWSAERYARTAHFVPTFGAPVLELLAPRAGERILDVGCGDGVLTEKIAGAGADVIAVDAAPDMVAAAK